jgi:uncharacterized protein YbbC (DUF1343 family)
MSGVTSERAGFRTGLEVCVDASPDASPAAIGGRRFGLLMNQASVDASFRYAHELLNERFPDQLAALFGPQHGMFGEQQDNMIETPHAVHPELGVPVHSLYAERRKPTPVMLEGLELFVVDLQDVGTRVYTFVWTVTYCLEACAEAGIPVLVLDRPNPIGGSVIEGPSLDPAFASFVGREAIPMRHGLTLAELVLYLNDAMELKADVSVVPMEGWTREMLWPDTGRTWVATSPNLPRYEGVLVYPGQVLLEGTELSEGRGTTTPFELVGAPFVDPRRLLAELRDLVDDAVILREIRFEPTFQKLQGLSCAGVCLHPVDAGRVRSYRLTLALIGAVQRCWPGEFRWRQPPYEYEAELMPFDILTGSDRARVAIDAGLTAAALDELCAVDDASWSDATADYRLYR